MRAHLPAVQPPRVPSAVLQANARWRLANTLLLLGSFLVFLASPFWALVYLLAFLVGHLLLGRIAVSRKAQFSCVSCGLCCRLRVTPSEQEIRRIERKAGPRNRFLDGPHLKRPGGFCIFLRQRGQETACSIYAIRPAVCRKWPFHDRGPSWGSFFLCPSLRALFRRKAGLGTEAP